MTLSPPAAAAAYRSEQDRLGATLGRCGLLALPLFFGLGLLLVFTPCVLPLVPMLSGIIGTGGTTTPRDPSAVTGGALVGDRIGRHARPTPSAGTHSPRAGPWQDRVSRTAVFSLSSQEHAMRSLTLFSLLLVLVAAPVGAFELQRMDGTRTNVNDYVGDGRWTLVMLWTTDCIPCEAQKPMIGAFHDAYADTRAHVVGIALDGPAAMSEIEALVARHAAAYPTLVAFDDVFDEQFAALVGKPFRATPTYLLYAPDGRFAGAHTGPIERERLEAIVASGG